MTRKSRRKPLKSLKTDSAIRGVAVFGLNRKLRISRQQPAQDETGRLAAARRRVAFASHRRTEESSRGDKTLRTRE